MEIINNLRNNEQGRANLEQNQTNLKREQLNLREKPLSYNFGSYQNKFEGGR